MIFTVRNRFVEVGGYRFNCCQQELSLRQSLVSVGCGWFCRGQCSTESIHIVERMSRILTQNGTICIQPGWKTRTVAKDQVRDMMLATASYQLAVNGDDEMLIEQTQPIRKRKRITDLSFEEKLRRKYAISWIKMIMLFNTNFQNYHFYYCFSGN